MKPIQLTLTAFGPYKEKEVIDFRQLGAHRLFAISGQTGAGKTTIFDGISYALFGSGSGEDRKDTKTMRSDFADDKDYTAVELLFELRGKTYRILRQQGHVKKGNKTATGERFEFFEVHADGTETPAVDRQKVSDINKRLEELLGLTQQQFKQIVMLPQGEFRKLLTSDSKEKEEILRKIFKTEPYDQLVKKLDAKRLVMQKETAKARATYEAQVQQLRANLPQRESELFTVLAQENHNVYQVLEALKAEETYYTEQLPLHEATLKQYEQQQSALYEQLGQAKQFNDQLSHYEQTFTQLTALEAQQQTMRAVQQQLEAALRAKEVHVYEQQRTVAMQEMQQAKQVITTVEAERKRLSKQFTTAQASYQEQQAQTAAREDDRIQLDRLQQLLPLYEARNEKHRALQQLQAEQEKAKQQYDEHQERLTNFKILLESVERDYREQAQKASDLSEAERSYYEAQKRYDAYRALQQQQQIVQATFEKVEQQYEKFRIADEHYRQQYECWLQNEAAQLADLLEDGKPCAVCGSTEHPKKAQRAADVLSKAEIEKLQANATEQQRIYSECKAIHTQAAQLRDEYMKRCEELAMNEADYPHIAAQLEAQRQRVDIAQQAQQQSQKLLKQLDNGKLKLTQELENERAQVAVLQQLQMKVQVDTESLREVTARLPQQFASEEALREQITQLQQQLQQATKRFEQAEAQYQHAQRQYEAIENRLKFSEEALQKESVRFEQATTRFDEALAALQFSDEAHYKEAKRSDSEREAMREQLATYEDAYKRTKAIVENGEAQFSGKQRIALEQLEQQLQQVTALVQQAQATHHQLTQYATFSARCYTDIAASSKEVDALLQQENELTTLYDVLRGKNPKKISFERYVQIGFLEQITEAANIRLRYLSNGQFTLQCSDRLEGGGKQSGLSLDVYDAYTGLMRDVKTLSGGEKFNASLALALGMADVIQSFQGNIQIETMFIDEGFGSLDEETLTKAVDTLVDLQKSGRMIGIISHVNELKAAMPAVLQVTKSKEGFSTTSFIVK